MIDATKTIDHSTAIAVASPTARPSTGALAEQVERVAAGLPKLYAALAKAQAAIRGATKDTENPFFHSRYADLASVWEACRAPLTANELCVIQLPETRFEGEPEVYTFRSKAGEERSGIRVPTQVTVRTRLGHSSGEFVEDVVSALLPAGDPQAVGSAITYLRRYALAAMVGVAPEDDDGEATTRPVPKGVDRKTGEISGGNAAPAPEAVTLETEVPFGKHKGKTVKDAGSGYFDHLAGQSDFAEAKGRAWHTFTLGAVAAFAAADAKGADAEKMDADDDAELFGEPPAPAKAPEPDPNVPPTPTTLQELRELLARPEVPERTRATYSKMLDGLGADVTAGDCLRIRASVMKAAKAAA